MRRLHFSITVEAPREKVWETMLGDTTYRQWTSAFAPGSYYEGDWGRGSKILFLAPGEDGKLGGMVTRIAESRPPEYVSIEHLGMVQDGREDTESEAVKEWAGARESYTLKEIDGGTEVSVEMDTTEEHEAMFEEIWPKALQKLKELAES
ncbi:MAG TPA: SRPBCC domain-containing protein [Thermoanaerobaculia bacterium]|nr:SRPBCC domain-containing protein [Thermoanaerobaculia bacterium]